MRSIADCFRSDKRRHRQVFRYPSVALTITSVKVNRPTTTGFGGQVFEEDMGAVGSVGADEYFLSDRAAGLER